jgi:threonine dehydratase
MPEQLTEQYIREVWATLHQHIKPTTFHSTYLLDKALGAHVTIASETLQITGSFKFRAAYNLLATVPNEEVITASSGNFGQAVAYACMLLGKRCTIIMPSTSSKTKQDAIRAYGGTVDIADMDVTTRLQRAAEVMADHPDAFFAPPYDHYRVVAGNSTLGKEIFDHFANIASNEIQNRPDVIVCPIGGGGLISGIIVARDILAPEVEIIGAEPLLGNDAAQSLRAGHLIALEAEPPTMADGTRTLSVGNINWEIISKGLRRIVEVPEEKIAEGVRLLYSRANLKVEPTGALATGALLTQPDNFAGRRVCCIVSGGNVDIDTYTRVLSTS